MFGKSVMLYPVRLTWYEFSDNTDDSCRATIRNINTKEVIEGFWELDWICVQNVRDKLARPKSERMQMKHKECK